MALITCTECGKEFSDKAPACPQCGCPTSEITGASPAPTAPPAAPAVSAVSAEEASQKMLDAVAVARKAGKKAAHEFDNGSEMLAIKSKYTTIDLNGGHATDKALDLVASGRMLCDALYAAYQGLIISLDGECRPLLQFGPSTHAVKEVTEAIRYFNSESEISNNIGASFNGAGLGNVASAKYIPSIQNKMTEQFWVSKYDVMPGTKEENEAFRKRESEEARREFQAKRDTEKLIRDMERQEREEARKKEQDAVAAARAADAKDGEKLKKLRHRYAFAARMIACGYDHVVAVRPDGTVVAAGKNDKGQCNVSGWRNVVAVACDHDATVGLTADGRVYYAGNSYHRQNACTGWRNIAAISFDSDCVMGLTDDGSVVATSENANGASRSTKSDVTTWCNITDIDQCGIYWLGVTKDGAARCVSRNYYCLCEEAYFLDGTKDVAEARLGNRCAVYRTKDGKIFATGGTNSGVIDPVEINKKSGVVRLEIIGGRPIALLADGTVFAEPGQRGNSKAQAIFDRYKKSPVVAVSVGSGGRLVLLTADGKIFTDSVSTLSNRNDAFPREECFGSDFRLFGDFDKLMDNMEKAEQAALAARAEAAMRRKEESARTAGFIKNGLCRHCGGEFKKSLLGMKCAACGKRKDY